MILSAHKHEDTKTRSIFLYLVFSFLILWPALLQAQQPGARYKSFDDFLESLLEESDETTEYASLVEELQELHENPIRINTASPEEMQKIPFLNELQASRIIEYRRKHGPFFSVFELASIPGIGRDLAEKISFFITTETTTPEEPADTLYKKHGIHQISAAKLCCLSLFGRLQGKR
jgi:competence ComEA-like helix-hairpin-helix protein